MDVLSPSSDEQELRDEVRMTRRSLLGGATAAALGALMEANPGSRALGQLALAHNATAAPSTPLVADRWLEIDLYWFRQANPDDSAARFWKRYLPLYAGLSGYRGVILNVAWTVGPVMEWSGDLQQKVSVPTGAGNSLEQPVNGWIAETAPLSGTTEERKQQWKARFTDSGVGGEKRRLNDTWKYADLRKLSAALKAEAGKNGIHDFKVGMFNTGGSSAYGEQMPWAHRHPEAFSPKGGHLDPNALLHADTNPLGGLPHGIQEGTPVRDVYAAQWGSLSKAVGFDAILLRDNIGLPVTYKRGGPWGPVAPSPELIRTATEGVSILVRKTKQANPDALVMMYSNGASAVADWRSNGLDLERIAQEGYLDIWIDQSWSGSWNEVGDRRKSFWNSPVQGWTYQLGYILLHGAVLSGTKVRHYPLIETFDAWEDWDILHSVPEKLRWAIWAYSHAAVKTPQGLRMPAGSYISWCNRGDGLLTDADVQFLSENINAAFADARQTTEVYGPTLVYSRESMQWQAEHAHADADIKEWIDEQAGTVVKWPLPIQSVTRVEWLPQVTSDLFILQSPSHLKPEHTAYIAQLIAKGQPVAIFGDPASGVESQLGALAGLSGSDGQQSGSTQKYKAELSPHLQIADNMPPTFDVVYRLAPTEASKEAQVIYSVNGSPELTLNRSAGKRVVAWDPPELLSRISNRSPLLQVVKLDANGPVMERLDGQMDLPLRQLWGNTGAPYALVAGALNTLLSSVNALHVTSIDLRQTMTLAAWSTKTGGLRVLAGNLEEGIRDDADASRHATLVLPAAWKTAQWQDRWNQHGVQTKRGELQIDLGQAKSVLLQAIV